MSNHPAPGPEPGRRGGWPLRRLLALLEHPDRRLTLLAFIIGAVTALGALGFSWLIEVSTHFYFEILGKGLTSVGLYYWLLPLLPMSGAILVGLITFYFAPEAEGHGVPEVSGCHGAAQRPDSATCGRSQGRGRRR